MGLVDHLPQDVSEVDDQTQEADPS